MSPTAEVYARLLDVLKPDKRPYAEMDRLFMTIRKTPPPDVCEFIIKNQELIPLLRAMANGQPTQKQVDELLASFDNKNIKGETDNG